MNNNANAKSKTDMYSAAKEFSAANSETGTFTQLP